jgi:hypothetical protein
MHLLAGDVTTYNKVLINRHLKNKGLLAVVKVLMCCNINPETQKFIGDLSAVNERKDRKFRIRSFLFTRFTSNVYSILILASTH